MFAHVVSSREQAEIVRVVVERITIQMVDMISARNPAAVSELPDCAV
jgi:hypothetical protein